MKILIGFEESQAICIAFREKGHEAYSCDLLPCSGGHPEWHLQMDIFQAIHLHKWDLIILHPPCTYTALCGNRWYWNSPLRIEGIKLCKDSWDVACSICDCVVLEQPKTIMQRYIGRKSQVIHPWQFGHGETKETWLWLKGLPRLYPTNIVNGRENRIWKMQPSAERSKIRSKTYIGIAKALADQYNFKIKSMETNLQTTDKSISVDVKLVALLQDAVEREAAKITQFLKFPITDERLKDANQLYPEIKVIRKNINDQVEAICQPLKDKKKDIDALQAQVKTFAENILKPMDDADSKLKAAMLAHSQRATIRFDRAIVLQRYNFVYEDGDLADLSPEDYKEVFEYAKSMFVPTATPVGTATPVSTFVPSAPAPKVTGMRKDWVAEVINHDLIPRQYLMPDITAINAAVRGGIREIPGVKIYEKESIR
jgi:hypothetical protein